METRIITSGQHRLAVAWHRTHNVCPTCWEPIKAINGYRYEDTDDGPDDGPCPVALDPDGRVNIWGRQHGCGAQTPLSYAWRLLADGDDPDTVLARLCADVTEAAAASLETTRAEMMDRLAADLDLWTPDDGDGDPCSPGVSAQDGTLTAWDYDPGDFTGDGDTWLEQSRPLTADELAALAEAVPS